MKKLKMYGIVGNAYALIKSYLSGGYQQVVIDDNQTHSHILSEWGKAEHGVPQGSVLGPVLFPLYIHDVCKAVNINSKLVLYGADSGQVMWVFLSVHASHYRRLIYYLYIILLHVSVVRPSSGRKYINS
jgi:hypothetical protein